MSAIRNVGELASPYYLLEVWARREDIDIDPETFATLKRKARALVRDARGFESRSEAPDQDWRDRRRDLLAIDPLRHEVHVLDDGTPFELGVWCESSGSDALLVGEPEGSDDPDQRGPDRADPVSTQFELALDAYRGEADWGLLLAGLQVRVYRRSSGISQQYLVLDLDTLVELDDEPTWKAFAAMFRAPAFAGGPDGVPLIRRVVDESRRHASALAADMRRDVVDAAEALLQGILSNPANAALVGTPTRTRLQELFEESLYVLYRVLFVLFAESRDVLPIGGRGPYATSYSLEHLVELARRGAARFDGTYFDETLITLFSMLWSGPSEMTARLGFEPVGGELFDPESTPIFSSASIADPAWERALTSIALGAPDSPRRKMGRRSSFGELGVDQLGSIYEGLLVLEPYLATEPAYLGAFKGERRVFVDPDVDGFNVLRHLAPGDFVLESAGGRRKGSGSFYTPHEITEYLTHTAVDPLVETILEKAHDDPDAAARAILNLKVCDPAMGSGAFLVQAARVLAIALARVRALRGDGLVTPDRVQQAKREVVRHCLYGVDLNPLAVVLAKVSLWLETLEPGRPLSFLDAHLRCGDSLVGVDFVTADGQFTAMDLATVPANATKGLETYLKKEAGDRGAEVLTRLANRIRPKATKQAQLPGLDRSAIESALEALSRERDRISQLEEGAETLFDALSAKEAFDQLEVAQDSIRNQLRRASDFWCSQWFSDGEDAPRTASGPVVAASIGEFEQIVAAYVAGAAMPERYQTQVEAADMVSHNRRFFHWALEFPEVFFERGGFDVVLGNPPWNTLSPDVKEFFGTYDPTIFRKGVPPAIQTERKEELRSDLEIDTSWRRAARFLHELSNYAKPESGRFRWYAEDGQLRKGDANVFRLFVERAYRLLRVGGRLGQVLPDSVYMSSPATGVRQHLLADGILARCWVFENRKKIFPIDGRIKVVLLSAQRGGGPTESFRAAFFSGKDAAGRDRAVGVEALPDLLAELDQSAPVLTVDQIKALAPETLAFPELQTALDAEILAHCAGAVPPLNLDERGWKLTYCRELDADRDAHRFKDAVYLESIGALPDGLRWVDPDGSEWWPLVEGVNIYHLEFPAQSAPVSRWVRATELRSLSGRINADGTLVADHVRVARRNVGSSTNERSVVATLLPARTIAKHSAITVRGGTQSFDDCVALAGVLSSFCFDFLFRMSGKTNMTNSAVDSIPAPSAAALGDILLDVIAVASHACAELGELKSGNHSNTDVPMDDWEVGLTRAAIDARVAVAYGLSLSQYAALLSTFPNLDRSQPMLANEPKSFVTRDLALRAFCDLTHVSYPNIAKLMREIGSGLPDPRPEYGDLGARLTAYRSMGAVPYRPTPRGGRTPTDPAVVEEILDLMSDDPLTADEMATAIGEDEAVVAAILKSLRKSGEIYSEGRGKTMRYYLVEED